MSSAYFYIIVGAFLFGVGVSSLWSLSNEVAFCLLWLGLVLLVYSGRLSFLKRKTPAVLLCLSLFLVFSSLGIWRMNYEKDQFANSGLLSLLGETATMETIVVGEPECGERSTKAVVELRGEKIMLITDRYTDIQYGDRLSVSGQLEKPLPFTTEFERVFSYPEYLRARGIDYVLLFPDKIEIVGHEAGQPLITGLLKVKGTFMETIETYLPPPASSLGLGLLLGVKQALGEELETAFRETGVIHIVVLSGFNVMIVVTAVLYLLGRVFPLRIQLVVGLVAITLFALMVGLSATVVRASLMAGLVLVAKLIGRQYNIMRALFLAGAIMVFVHPYILLFDIGFQLSFMATLGLIIFAPQFEFYLEKRESWYDWRSLLIATTATQLAVLPLLVFYVGQVSLISIVVNLIILPLVPVAMLLTFLVGVIGLVGEIVWPVAFLAYLLLAFMIKVVVWFAGFPYATFLAPSIPPYGVILLYFLLGVAWYLIDWYRQIRTDKIRSLSLEVDEIENWEVEEEEILAKQIQASAVLQK